MAVKEVERRFDVVESTVSPSFQGIAAVARVQRLPSQSLEAVYFDTPAHDLAARGITLRRRSGGSEAGWHLNLPAGPDIRTGIRTPWGATASEGGAVVPTELLEVVLAIVRDRPLAPVARITTSRDVDLLNNADSTVLAEFCDDRVTASVSGTLEDPPAERQWREWELKLVGADVDGAVTNIELLDRLSNRLLDTGAAPAAHGSELARVLDTTSAPDHLRAGPVDPVRRAMAEQVDELLVWDRAVRADVDDAVHQMRVTTRKIRSLLQAGGDSFNLSDDAWILDELQQLAGVLGVARDAEVLAARYRRALDRLPLELVRGPVRERLIDGAERRYRSGLHRSLIAMRSQRYFRLLDALDVLADEPAAAGGQTPAPVTLDAAYKRVRAAAKAAAKTDYQDRDEALHRIRKGAKRLRYTAAATGAAKVSARAKVIQTLLGDHQDSVVSRAHLSHHADAAYTAGEDTFTYGLLYQQDEDLARSCREQLGSALAKLDKSVAGRVGL